MTPEQRRNAIIAQARAGGRLEVDALSETMGASRETIRRDLAVLDNQGLLRRVHGGAVLGQPVAAAQEGPFAERMAQAVAAKRAMARHVAADLLPGDSLFLDTGSSTLYLAEELAQRSGLTIITNSADIAALCQQGRDNRVVLIGGEFRAAGRETVGPLALAQIGQLRAGRAVLTVAAVTPHGVYDIDGAEAEVARLMARQAERVVVLADGTKMGRAGVYEVCPWTGITQLVTDAMPAPLCRIAETAGCLVEIVSPG